MSRQKYTPSFQMKNIWSMRRVWYLLSRKLGALTLGTIVLCEIFVIDYEALVWVTAYAMEPRVAEIELPSKASHKAVSLTDSQKKTPPQPKLVTIAEQAESTPPSQEQKIAPPGSTKKEEVIPPKAEQTTPPPGSIKKEEVIPSKAEQTTPPPGSIKKEEVVPPQAKQKTTPPGQEKKESSKQAEGVVSKGHSNQEGSGNSQEPAVPENTEGKNSFSDDLSVSEAVAWWKFDETQGTVARDTNHRNPAVVESGIWKPGVVGNALYFQNTTEGRVVVKLSPVLRLDGDLSISFWIRLADFPPQPMPLITYGALGETAAENTLYSISVNSEGELIYRHEFNEGIDQQHVFHESALAKNEWFFVTITRNAAEKEVTLFLNGVAVGIHEYQENPNGGEKSSLYLLFDPSSQPQVINAAIDELILSGEIMPTSEIKQSHITRKGAAEAATERDVFQEMAEEAEKEEAIQVTQELESQEPVDLVLNSFVPDSEQGFAAIDYFLSPQASEAIEFFSSLTGEFTGEEIPMAPREDGNSLRNKRKTFLKGSENEIATFFWDVVADKIDLKTQPVMYIRAHIRREEKEIYSLPWRVDFSEPPVISSLRAYQIPKTDIAAIAYHLEYNTPTEFTVNLEISEKGNQSWETLKTNLGGTVGANQHRGEGWILWRVRPRFENREGNIQVRVRATDPVGNVGFSVESSEMVIDTKAPIGPKNFRGVRATPSSITWSWIPAQEESSFHHYEIWYGLIEDDVLKKSGSAKKWDSAYDPDLQLRGVTSTTITGLNLSGLNIVRPSPGPYFAQLRAVDRYGNEASSEITSFSTPPPQPKEQEKIVDVSSIQDVLDSFLDSILPKPK